MIDNNMVSFLQMSVLDIPEVFDVRPSTVQNVVTIQELEDEYGLTPESLVVAMSGSSQGMHDNFRSIRRRGDCSRVPARPAASISAKY